MALIKAGEVLGLPTNIYAKITNVIISESGADQDGKLYAVDVVVTFFTNETAVYSFKQETFKFYSVREANFNLAYAYAGLKTLEQFEGFADA